LNKKTLYAVIAILLVLGVYGYEHFLKEDEKAEIIQAGKVVKMDTNAYFLPASTIGQIVHHEGYSLSYSEPHE
jgi:endonuclease G